MTTQYTCKQLKRRNLVLAQKAPLSVNGIDYLEVAPGDQSTLLVHFLFPLPGQPNGVPTAPLKTANIGIQGGVRITGITVKTIVASGNLLTVTVNSPGDFSTYTLKLVATSDQPGQWGVPTGFDPQLSSVDFSFKVECPSQFDCQQEHYCPPPSFPAAQIDYLAKDYSSFRQLILDRLAVTMPAWQERHSADIGITLVELLAYAGDHLSYYQDAVATEAYLGTARQRISVRRHARLLDYYMHDGCNARTWVHFRCDQGSAPVLIPLQTMLLTQTGLPTGPLDDKATMAALAEGAQVFETMFEFNVHPEWNELQFYTWSDDQCCLPKGATTATLVDDGAGDSLHQAVDDSAKKPPKGPPVYLLFEEVVGPSGAKADANPAHRQAVRLTQATPGTDPLDGTKIIDISWDPADALQFPLCLSTTMSEAVSVAQGNIVLADHGMSQTEQLPTLPPAGVLYRPRLKNQNLTFNVPFDIATATLLPASQALVQIPSLALPAINLTEDSSTTAAQGQIWKPLQDLLKCTSTDLNFVVEMENDGSARLRFGDDQLGKTPTDQLFANYRMGNGPNGNVGAESIVNIAQNTGSPTAFSTITSVRNPLPAQSGTAGETLDEVRANAPWAFRTQKRAVTVADYATVAERHPEVKRAQATLRWTGSWYTIFVTVEPIVGVTVDATFIIEIRAFIEQFRLAGYDLEIEAPIYVPLDIAFSVCVAPGYLRQEVEATLLQTFSNRLLPNGKPGFFYSDNFTFGQPVYLSQIVATAMQVPGVRWVDTDDLPSPSPNHFVRWGQKSNGETQAGKIAMARLEIARLDNDPNQPEHGKIAFIMEGGQ